MKYVIAKNSIVCRNEQIATSMQFFNEKENFLLIISHYKENRNRKNA